MNAHLWEFPNVELAPDDSDLEEAARRVLGVRPKGLEAVGTIKHSITRYRINLEVCQLRGRQADRIPTAKGRWLSPKRLHELAFASAHRRILQGLGAA